MKLFERNKKANAISEGIFILVVLTVLGIITVIGFSVFNMVNDEIQADPEMSADSKAVSDTLNTQYPALFDGIFLFLVVGLWIAAIIFSFMIDTSPIFLVITIILLIIVLFISALLANAYGDVTEDSTFAADAIRFPMMNFVFSHFVETILVIMISVSIALFVKSRVS
jgi:uncharacterized membrane protein YjgN (DUF898 family)